MKQFRTIFGFEYKSYVTSKAFIAVSIVMIALALIAPCIPTVITKFTEQTQSAEDESGKLKIAIADKNNIITPETTSQYLNAVNGMSIKYYRDDGEAAKADVRSGEMKLALVFGANGDPYSYVLYMANMNLSDLGILSSYDEFVKRVYAVNMLSAEGVTEEQANEILNYSPNSRVETIAVEGGGDMEADENAVVGGAVFAYVLEFVLYFALILYGQYICVSVIREKSTKTMELLITSAKPIWLIFGKVIGVCLAGLTQLGGLVAAGALSLWVNGKYLDPNSTVGAIMNGINVSPALIVYLFVFFLLGFFTYAFLYAAFSSMASRMEDANTVVTIPMLLVVAAFFVSIYGMNSAHSGIVVVTSFLPFFGPMVMYMRLCLGAAATWEALVSIAVSLVSVVGIAAVSAKLYRMGTLMYGKPPKLGEIFKMFIRAEGR